MIKNNNNVTFAYTSRALYTIELEMESCWPVKHLILIQLYIIVYNMYKNTFSGRAFDDPSAKRLSRNSIRVRQAKTDLSTHDRRRRLFPDFFK